MNFKSLVFIPMLALTACIDSDIEKGCSSDLAQKLVGKIISEKIEAYGNETNKDHNILDMSLLRSNIALVKFDVASIRTTKNDPNSTKKFCEAELSIVIPPEIIKKVELIRSEHDLGSIEKLVNDGDYKVEANSYKHTIEYSAQPTDDNKELSVELNTAGYINLPQEIILTFTLKNQFDEKRHRDIEEAKEKIAQQEEEERIQQEEEQAIQAELDEAENSKQLAVEKLTALIATIPEDQKPSNLKDVDSLIRNIGFQCNIFAISNSRDPKRREIVSRECQTTHLNHRIDELSKIYGSNV